MKRIISMILIAVLLAFQFTMVADAHSAVDMPKAQSVEEPAQAEVDKDGVLYKERMKELYKYKDYDFTTWSGELISYKELYYHKDTSGEIEWALVLAQTNMEAPALCYTIIGNRVFKQPQLNSPFATDYGIYDVKKDTFIDVTNTHIFNEADYPGFARIFTKYAKRFRDGNGRLLGDTDGDDELSIIDCTMIQRCATRIGAWPADDLIDPDGDYSYFNPLTYYSDFDRDGERNAVDATKLQRYVTLID